MHGTTVLCVRRDNKVVIAADGQVTMGEHVMKHTARKTRRLFNEKILAGFAGSTADAFRITDSHDDGRGAIACIREALADARINPDQIDYINAHGTSTKVNDSIETLAIKKAFGEAAYQVPISSTKSMMGHLIAAAGSVEAIVCLLAIRDGLLPPTINLDQPDSDCDLDYIPHESRRKSVDIALSNSFGFGGQNITLILRRFTD